MLRKIRNLFLKLGALAAIVAVILGYLAFEFSKLSNDNQRVEQFLTQQIGTEVEVAKVFTAWSGLRPRMIITGLRLRQAGSDKSVGRLGELRFTLNPLPLLWGELSFTKLELDGPTLTVQREADGQILFGGIPVSIKGGERKGGGFLNWLFRQDQIELRDGTLAWSDAMSGETGLELTHINLLVQRTGDRRRFNGRLRLPDSNEVDITLDGQFFGHPLDTDSKGNLSLTTQQIALGKLPAVINERIPWQLMGEADLELYLAWVKGSLVAARSRIGLADFSALLPTGNQFAASEGSAEVDWRKTAQGSSVTRFNNVTLKNQGKIIEFPEIELEQDQSQLQARLGDSTLTWLIDSANILEITLPHWFNTKASAMLSETIVEYKFKQQQPWLFTTQFANAAYPASDRQPGLENFNGQLKIHNGGGSVSLDTHDASLSYLRWFDQHLPIKSLTGEITWRPENNQWLIETNQIQVEAAGVKATVDQLVVPWRKGIRDFSDLLVSASVSQASIADARVLIPNKLPARLYHWLNQALASGEIHNGKIYLRGDPRKLKLTETNHGVELSVSASIKDAVLQVHPKWPTLIHLYGEINFTQSRFHARLTEGLFLSTQIEEVIITSDHLYRRDGKLSVQAVSSGPLQDGVIFLTAGSLLPKLDSTTKIIASGNGWLNLELELPMAKLKNTSVNGSYQFVNGEITVGEDLKFNDVTAKIKFTEKSVSSDRVIASFLGGQLESRLSSSALKTPEWKVALTGSGELQAKRLSSLIGKQLAGYLGGGTQWQASTTFSGKGVMVDAHSELQGLSVNLPSPLTKSADSSSPFFVRAELLNKGKRKIRFQQQGKMGGLLHWHQTKSAYEFYGGNLSIGNDVPTTKINPVLRVDINLDELDFDPWLATINQSAQSHTVEQHSGPMSALREIHAQVGRFRMFNKSLGALKLDAFTEDADRWAAKINGDALAGTMVVVTHSDPVKLDFELSHLYWPKSDNEQNQQQDVRPTELPEIHVGVDSFRFRGRDLGQLIFRAHPVEAGWRIGYLQIDHPSWQLLGDGLWSRQSGIHHTSLQLDVQTDRLGNALDSWGYPGQLVEGNGKLTASLYWNDQPAVFSWQKLNGSYSINLAKGRFLSINPGTGRLLGLFNIETLARRFVLDFSDVFKEGLTFDRITGTGIVDNGSLYSDGIYLAGPAVLIESAGRVGLAEEDYDLNVSVAPQWGANLSFLSALANPAAGAVVFLAQKLFKKQLSKLVRYRYTVTGFWDDPIIERVKIDPDKK